MLIGCSIELHLNKFSIKRNMYYITDPINKLLAMLITLLLGPMLCHTDRNAGQCLVQRREMA